MAKTPKASNFAAHLATLDSALRETLGDALPRDLIRHLARVTSQGESISASAATLTEARQLHSQSEANEKKLAAKQKQKPQREKALAEAAEKCGKTIFEAHQSGDLQANTIFTSRLTAEEELKAAKAEADAAKAKPGASFWARTAAAFKSLGPSSRVSAAEKACKTAECELVMRAITEDLLGQLECKSTKAAIGAVRSAFKLVDDLNADVKDIAEEQETLLDRLRKVCGAKRKDERAASRLVADLEKKCKDKSSDWWASAEDVLVGLLEHLDEHPATEQQELLHMLDAALTAFSEQVPGSNEDRSTEAEWLVMHGGRERGPFPSQQVTALINGSILGRGVRVKHTKDTRWRLGLALTHFTDSLKDAVALSGGGLRDWPTGRKATVQISIPAKPGPEVKVRLLCDEHELYTFRSTTGVPRFDHEVTLDRHVYVLECPQPLLSPTGIKNYPVTCSLAGHYRLEWDKWPNAGTQMVRQLTLMSSMQDMIMPWSVTQTYTLEGTTRIAPSPRRQKQFIGLWEKPGDSSQQVLVTEDGWILMPDGESAKYSWLDKDTVIFEADEDNDEALFKVASLTDRELALIIDNQILRFRRGQTLSEREAARLRAEAEERAVILRAKAKQAAAEVGKGLVKGAAVLALVSVAAVGAVTLAAASAASAGGGGGSGGGYGGGGSEDIEYSPPKRRPANSSGPENVARTEPELGTPIPLRGCIIRKVLKRSVTCSHKCEFCGHVTGSTFSVGRLGSGSAVYRSGFVCEKCHKQQAYEIQS